MLKSNWTKEQIVGLLASPNCDARKVAALALSLVGLKKLAGTDVPAKV